MSKTTIQVTIEIEVYDEEAFRRAAYERALKDELGDKEAAQYLDDEEHSLTDCAIMLLDPGESPDGCQIENSSAEELCGRIYD